METQTETAQPQPKVKFRLTVEIEGDSLDLVDNGLIQAAGQRLAARMVGGAPKFNGQPIVPGVVPEAPPTAAAEPAPSEPVEPTVARIDREVPPAVHSHGSPAQVEHLGADTGAASGGGPSSHAVPGATGGADAGSTKKRGVKPGTKRGSYNKAKGAETHAEEKNETESQDVDPVAQSEAGREVHEGHEVPEAGDHHHHEQQPSSAPAAVPADTAPTPRPTTLQDAVNALKLVNSKKNVETAKKALEHFGVAKCSDLTDVTRPQFIAYCEAMCK